MHAGCVSGKKMWNSLGFWHSLNGKHLGALYFTFSQLMPQHAPDELWECWNQERCEQQSTGFNTHFAMPVEINWFKMFHIPKVHWFSSKLLFKTEQTIVKLNISISVLSIRTEQFFIKSKSTRVKIFQNRKPDQVMSVSWKQMVYSAEQVSKTI